jgi:hypothetical protein
MTAIPDLVKTGLYAVTGTAQFSDTIASMVYSGE